MPEANPPAAAGVSFGNGADALAASRRILRDLASLLALPAMWVDHEAADIASGLLGVLFGMLRLDSAYVRFDDPAGGLALERWRPDGPYAPIELRAALAAAAPRERGAVTTPVAHLAGDGLVRVTSVAPTFPGEGGLVLVGCRRADFPTDLEQHLLRLAVGQATISIHTARRLAGERAARIAAETALERRNRFLATLAQNLSAPLTTLAEHAAQARNFASLSDRPPTTAPAAAAAAGNAGDPSGRTAVTSTLPASARLTRRETEVLGLLAQGLSNKEIAALLWLSERTVERHITGIYRKIAVERRS
jgi:DNA-binding CsgD family transcriptional regulator